MPTTISEANFLAAVGECYDAIAARSWDDANLWYALAEAQNAGLILSASDSSASLQRRDALSGLAKAIAQAQRATQRTSDRRRLIRTQTAHGDWGRDRQTPL